MLKIENGCTTDSQGGWIYRYTDVKDGPVIVPFTVSNGEVPEIGDFIVGNVLMKRKGYQISNEGRLKWPSDPDGSAVFDNWAGKPNR